MAQKRMFDRSIIETDNFLDLPTSCKALYFLLGMEADDEGFVSPKRVMRIYGGSDDDIKILSAKQFVIPFESGVVVITNWNENNYLDKTRIKPTKYAKEREMLALTDNKTYVFNRCLTDVKPEERRIEENRGEESKNSSISFLKNIPKEVLKEFEEKFKCDKSNIITKANSLFDYCESKGKRYKNYKAFLANALRKDFGERPPKAKKPIYEISGGVARIVGFE